MGDEESLFGFGGYEGEAGDCLSEPKEDDVSASELPECRKEYSEPSEPDRSDKRCSRSELWSGTVVGLGGGSLLSSCSETILAVLLVSVFLNTDAPRRAPPNTPRISQTGISFLNSDWLTGAPERDLTVRDGSTVTPSRKLGCSFESPSPLHVLCTYQIAQIP